MEDTNILVQSEHAQQLLDEGFPPEVVAAILIASALREMSFGSGDGHPGPLEKIGMELANVAHNMPSE